MRIAIIVDTFPSLSETFISNKVIGLSARGHAVIVFCNKNDRDILNRLSDDLKNVRIRLITRKKIFLYAIMHPGFLFSSIIRRKHPRHYIFRKFRSSIINRCKPDIIHFEFSGIGIDYLTEMDYLAGKVVVSCRGSAEKVKLPANQERKAKFSLLMQKADAIHCVSADMRNTIAPYCKNKEKIFVNFPSINTDFFKRDKPRTASNEKIILSVGRLTFQKGYLFGLLAAKLLKDAGLSFHWIIVGEGIKYDELVFKIRQLGLQHEVKLMGAGTSAEIKGMMENATVFFLPSVCEGIANVVLEAMSMELPVVSTRCGGMEEVITNGYNGLLTDLYDYVDMAAQLSALLTDEDLYNRIASVSRERIIEKFSLAKQIDCYEEVYNSAILGHFGAHSAKKLTYNL